MKTTYYADPQLLMQAHLRAAAHQAWCARKVTDAHAEEPGRAAKNGACAGMATSGRARV